ncbi:hypothetical protein I3760_01G132400 [Carya illinoinensis]|nr:hypothetical protein I3760_01G132400 [Carya illinoinensis]
MIMKTLQLVFMSTVAFLLIIIATDLKIRTNAERFPVVVGSVVLLEDKRRSKVGGSNPRLLTDRKGNVIGASTDKKDHKTAAANKVDGRAVRRTETKSTAGDNDMNDEGDEPNPSYHHAGCGSSTTSSHQLDHNPCWVHRNGVYLPTHRRRRPWRKRSSNSTLPNS